MSTRRPRDLSGKPLGKWVCSGCKENTCSNCIDVMRVGVLALDPICQCSKPKHSGEPRNNQVMDPITETVYGPELSVDKDGTVHRGHH